MILTNFQTKAQKTNVEQVDFVFIETLSDFKTYLVKNNVKISLKEGNYQIDDAESIRFIQITGSNSHFDLSDCRFMVDSKLFKRTDLKKSDDDNSMYCTIEISGYGFDKNFYAGKGAYIEGTTVADDGKIDFKWYVRCSGFLTRFYAHFCRIIRSNFTRQSIGWSIYNFFN